MAGIPGLTLEQQSDDQAAQAICKAQALDEESANRLLKAAVARGLDATAAELIRRCPRLAVLPIYFEDLCQLPLAAVAYAQREGPEESIHLAAAAGASRAVLEALVSAIGANVNSRSTQGANTPLHMAASADCAETCRALVALGADALIRNAKGKTPRTQAGLSEEVVGALLEAEELSKQRRAEKQSRLWDDKMKATQTASACRLGCV